MSRITLSRKLYALAVIPLLLGFVVSGLLAYRLQIAYAGTDKILSQSVRQQSIARDMRYRFKRQVQEWKDTLLRGHNPEDFNKYSANFRKQFKLTQDLSAALQEQITDPKIRELNTQFQAAYSEMGEKYEAALAVFEANGGRDPFSTDAQVRGIDRPPTVVLDQIVKLLTDRYDADQQSIRASIASQRLLTNVLLIVGTLFALAIVWVVVRFARKLSRSLQEITADLDRASRHTVDSSQQVSSSSQSLAQGASEQAASLEETSSTLEEISSMSQRSSENVGEAAQLASDTQNLTQQGNEAMERMSTAIDAIKNSADQTAKIIKTIDEIAFQTNLLALNAAVEAARAGDAGRGFAVVAEEVRNLATRSAAAAKDTNVLIEASQQRAEYGVTISGEVGEVLSEIRGAVDRVNALLGEVTRASQEQATGIAQITTGVSQMDQVVQGNAALAEEVAASSQEFTAQSENLRRAVRSLKRIVQGITESNGSAPALVASAKELSSTPRRGVPAQRSMRADAPQPKALKLREQLEQELGTKTHTPRPPFSALAETEFRDIE
ncbi:MAG TPA: methyl-accepting chemotaxis protein [bacterium]|nr:methyl-accepting chemotaxis protein [bacterium]